MGNTPTFANFDVLATGVAGASVPADSFGPGPGGAMAPAFFFGPGPGIFFGPGPGFAGAMPGPAPGPGRPWSTPKTFFFYTKINFLA